MAENDDLTTGTTGDATGTTASAADGSATPPADGSGGGESIEELRKRLQDEQRKNAQLLSERTNVEREREELRRQRETYGASPPPTAPVDPYMAQMQMLNATVARYGPDSYEGQVAIAQAHALEASRRAEYATNFLVQVERDLLKIPAEHRDDVKARILNGEYNSVGQAYEVVKGSRSSSTIEALQRELDDLRKQVNGGRPKTADVSTSIRTQVDAATHKRNMSLTEYQRVMDAGGPQASRLMKQVDDGEVVIDY